MFDKKKILVIGDIMLDIYYRGEVNRISPEAPVPVFKKDSEMSVLGGAANVAANLSAARQRVSMIAVTGKDMQGKRGRVYKNCNMGQTNDHKDKVFGRK